MKQYIVKVYNNRTKWYNQKDQLHREGGLPAVEYSTGTKEYWVNGEQITKEQAEQLAKPSCEGIVVEIDGRKFQLKEIIQALYWIFG